MLPNSYCGDFCALYAISGDARRGPPRGALRGAASEGVGASRDELWGKELLPVLPGRLLGPMALRPPVGEHRAAAAPICDGHCSAVGYIQNWGDSTLCGRSETCSSFALACNQ